MFTVYILYSVRFKKTYTGFTSDIKNRLLSHNELSTKGWTVKYRPWRLIYTEEYEDKKVAMQREKELKTGKGRDFVKGLITSL